MAEIDSIQINGGESIRITPDPYNDIVFYNDIIGDDACLVDVTDAITDRIYTLEDQIKPWKFSVSPNKKQQIIRDTREQYGDDDLFLTFLIKDLAKNKFGILSVSAIGLGSTYGSYYKDINFVWEINNGFDNDAVLLYKPKAEEYSLPLEKFRIFIKNSNSENTAYYECMTLTNSKNITEDGWNYSLGWEFSTGATDNIDENDYDIILPTIK